MTSGDLDTASDFALECVAIGETVRAGLLADMTGLSPQLATDFKASYDHLSWAGRLQLFRTELAYLKKTCFEATTFVGRAQLQTAEGHLEAITFASSVWAARNDEASLAEVPHPDTVALWTKIRCEHSAALSRLVPSSEGLEPRTTTPAGLAGGAAVCVGVANGSEDAVVRREDQSPATSGRQDSPMDAVERKLIWVMRENPRHLLQVAELAELADRSLRTVGTRLKSLKEKGLIHLPNGKRMGYQLTADGVDLAKRAPPSI